MKRVLTRSFPVLAAAAVFCFALYMLWPHSFAALQPECDSITILRTATAEDYSFITTKETYSADSPELAQILGILSRYTYHRSFQTLAGANGTEGNHAGYWINVYLDHGGDRVDFTCGGTGEVLIGGLAWRTGYWGDRASLAMMQELSDILDP